MFTSPLIISKAEQDLQYFHSISQVLLPVECIYIEHSNIMSSLTSSSWFILKVMRF